MHKLTLEELLQDALIAEKYMISMYEQFIKEASNVTLIDLLLDNFNELVETQHVLFLEMKERNMYPVTNAEKQKIEQTEVTLKQKRKSFEKDFKNAE